MTKPRVIFLDAVGTLFGIKGSVGEIYQAIARSFEVDAPVSSLNKAFFDAFKASPPLEFPHAKGSEVVELEFQWWQDIAQATFEQVGVFEEFFHFPTFFAKLYAHFATHEPWYVYPDVRPVLTQWREEGIELGIISNFDSRLYCVLRALGLRDYFSSITISSAIGAAKPSKEIFTLALSKHECLPQQAWHIGDSFQEDYQGAKAVGIRPLFLRRSRPLIPE